MTYEKENYITAGELASLYGIPKQTLLYYDKNELLVPEFVNENGYRYYSVSQFLDLELILNLRKLNISIQDIKYYLHNRSPENFERILKEKEIECSKIIEETKKIQNSLQLSLHTLEKIKETRFSEIQVNFQKEKKLFVSEYLTDDMSHRERFQILSRHNQLAFSKEHFKEFTTGWIIREDNFFAEKFNKTLQYFTPVSHTVPQEYCFVRPAGLYLTIRFKGTYYQQISSVYKEIANFIERNQLSACSNVYVFPLKNHWLTENTEAYINQLSFQVEYSS